jgi:hypothetical protein
MFFIMSFTVDAPKIGFEISQKPEENGQDLRRITTDLSISLPLQLNLASLKASRKIRPAWFGLVPRQSANKD